jgi:SPP1 gp7 family putative phage head morphogenesis protein
MLKWGIDLSRLDVGTQKKVIAILNKMTSELKAQLSGSLTEWGKTRVNKLLADAGVIIEQYHGKAANVAYDITNKLGTIASVSAQSTLSSMVPVALSVSLPTETYLKTLAGKAIIQGAIQAKWWKEQERKTIFNFEAQVRQGLAAGETNQQIINRVVGVTDLSKRQAATLVSTSIQTVANDARMETFKQNEELLSGYKYSSALDSKTCIRCGSLDGKFWKVGDLGIVKPVIHFSCRCQLLPITKTYAELGFPELNEPLPGKRASSNGLQPDTIKFPEFLKNQSNAFIEENLGKTRADMYLNGKITLRDLLDGNNKVLTIEQLHKKYA